MVTLNSIPQARLNGFVKPRFGMALPVNVLDETFQPEPGEKIVIKDKLGRGESFGFYRQDPLTMTRQVGDDNLRATQVGDDQKTPVLRFEDYDRRRHPIENYACRSLRGRATFSTGYDMVLYHPRGDKQTFLVWETSRRLGEIDADIWSRQQQERKPYNPHPLTPKLYAQRLAGHEIRYLEPYH